MSRVGLEPTTFGFSVQRSATELPRLNGALQLSSFILIISITQHTKKKNYINNNIQKVAIIKKINQQKTKCFQLYCVIWSILYLGNVPRIPIATKQSMHIFITKNMNNTEI